MKVVLHQQVPGLGGRGDIVDVSDGYARNSLIPKGLAQQATSGVTAQAESMKKAWQQRNAKEREAAEEIATRLVASPVEISARAGGEGKLFGSVSETDIAQAVQAQTGVELDRKMVSVDQAIREVGTHMVTIKPHADVQFPLNITVVAS